MSQQYFENSPQSFQNGPPTTLQDYLNAARGVLMPRGMLPGLGAQTKPALSMGNGGFSGPPPNPIPAQNQGPASAIQPTVATLPPPPAAGGVTAGALMPGALSTPSQGTPGLMAGALSNVPAPQAQPAPAAPAVGAPTSLTPPSPGAAVAPPGVTSGSQSPGLINSFVNALRGAQPPTATGTAAAAPKGIIPQLSALFGGGGQPGTLGGVGPQLQNGASQLGSLFSGGGNGFTPQGFMGW